MINWLMHRENLFVCWKLGGMLHLTKFRCAQYCETEDDACEGGFPIGTTKHNAMYFKIFMWNLD